MNSTYIARSTSIAARCLGGEMMVMSVKDSTFFTMNQVATTIWQAADGLTPLETIVREKVCSEYEIEPQAALQDAREFVTELSQHGILIVSENPIPQNPQTRAAESRS